MIIFDLDGTLADCEHRRHLVDCTMDLNLRSLKQPDQSYYVHEVNDAKLYKFKPNWKAFYEACDKDKPIKPVIQMMLRTNEPYEIWSGRCESVREKTVRWLCYYMHRSEMPTIRMRPIGDSTPDDVLKERWLNERCADLMEAQIEGRIPVKHDISFVVDDRPKVVKMWRRRGIFVFDVNQSGKEF